MTPTPGLGQETIYTEEDFDHIERTGPNTIMGKWLRRFWHPVYLSADLKQEWPQKVRLMGEDFALFRGKSGKVYMTQPQCPHRMARLDIGWMKDETVVCRYHGWQFDPETGSCVKQPLEQRPFCNTVKIKTYPVEEYLGLIFAYIGEGAPPPMERYPRLEGPDVFLEPTVNYHDYNYLQNRENDPLHTPFTHASLGGGGFNLRGTPASVRSKETLWGFDGDVINEDGFEETLQYGMPLTNNVPAASIGADSKLGVWTEHFGWKLPVDDEHGMHFVVFAAHVPVEHMEEYKMRREQRIRQQEAKLAGRKTMSIKEAAEAVLAGKISLDALKTEDVTPYGVGLVLVQDWVVQAGQGVVHSQRHKERLASSDATVVMFRRLVRRELKALAEGRPLKDWRFVEGENDIAPMGNVVTTELEDIDRDVKTDVL